MTFDFHNPQLSSGERPRRGNSPLRRLFFLAAILLLLTPGCLEPVDIEAPKDIISAVVIQGTLTKGDPSVVRVEISALFNFTGSSRRLINVQEVLLLNEAGESLEIPSKELGVYTTKIPVDDPVLPIVTGASYYIRVSTRDGRVYESTPEPILETPGTGKLSAEIIDKEVIDRRGEPTTAEYVRFSIETPVTISEQGEKAHLKWDAFKTYRATDIVPDPSHTCYITETAEVNKLWLLDGNTLSSDNVENFTVHEEAVGPRLAEGFYLTVYQQSLSEEAFRYWDEVNELIERTGSIFEPPAGKVRSNFVNINDPKDEAFGFFYAIAQDTVRLYVSPEFAGNPPPPCPPSGPLYNQSGDCNYQVCCDCLAVANSTLIKPSFWVE